MTFAGKLGAAWNESIKDFMSTRLLNGSQSLGSNKERAYWVMWNMKETKRNTMDFYSSAHLALFGSIVCLER